jgi:hypothetical protein
MLKLEGFVRMQFWFNFSYVPVIFLDTLTKNIQWVLMCDKFHNVLWLKITVIKRKTLCVIHPDPRPIHHSQVIDIPQIKPHRSTCTLHHLPSNNLFSLNYDVIWPSPIECKYVWWKSLKCATRSTHFTLKPLVNRSSILYADILFIMFDRFYAIKMYY